MKTFFSWIKRLFAAALVTSSTAVHSDVLDSQDIIHLDVEYGRIVIKLRPDLAPKHVERIKELSNSGFYDGAPWHRVIDGFMAQTGDPKNGNGTGGSDLPDLAAEFNEGQHVRGSLSMARAGNPNSANSQFFIVLDEAAHLNGQYTYFGQVIEGMEFVDQIRKGNPADNGSVVYPDRIVQMQVAK